MAFWAARVARKIPLVMVTGSLMVPTKTSDANAWPFTSGELGWYTNGKECTSWCNLSGLWEIWNSNYKNNRTRWLNWALEKGNKNLRAINSQLKTRTENQRALLETYKYKEYLLSSKGRTEKAVTSPRLNLQSNRAPKSFKLPTKAGLSESPQSDRTQTLNTVSPALGAA